MRFFSTVPLSVLLHAGFVAAIGYTWGKHERETTYVPPIPIQILSEAELGDLISIPELTTAEIETPDPVEPESTPTTPPPDPVEPVSVPTDDPAPAIPPSVPTEDSLPEEQPPADPPEAPVTPTRDPGPQPEDEPPVDPLAAAAAALANLEVEDDERTAPSEIRRGAADTDQVGEGRELTITEEAMLRARLESCWTPDPGALNASDLLVSVKIALDIDGSLREPPEVLNDGQITRSGNRYWLAARLRATSAVEQCAPFDFLDPGNYSNWEEIVFDFRLDDFDYN